MRRLIAVLMAVAALAAAAGPAGAETLSRLARVLPGARATDSGLGTALVLPLGRGVPWRMFTLADPPRLVLDFAEVDWTGFDPAGFESSRRVAAVRTGRLKPGWSRLVLELEQPMRPAQAVLTTGEPAELRITLLPQDEAAFRAAAGAPPGARFDLPAAPPAAAGPRRRQDGTRPVLVAIDPGHGGIDPGAERDGIRESDLVLGFARDLEECLVRAGFEVVLTRRDDRFVPLEARVSLARAAGADLFLSLHADIVTEGDAQGATLYTFADNAGDAAARKLAERHDRDDLLAGVDLTGQDDQVAGVLMDLARAETDPRSRRLADALVAGLGRTVGGLHKRPRMEADFSVLKAPDIPSVLLELGYLSSDADRARLTDPEWRARAALAIRDGLAAWAAADAAEARLIRR